jgi:hypothetical protein
MRISGNINNEPIRKPKAKAEQPIAIESKNQPKTRTDHEN